MTEQRTEYAAGPQDQDRLAQIEQLAEALEVATGAGEMEER